MLATKIQEREQAGEDVGELEKKLKVNQDKCADVQIQQGSINEKKQEKQDNLCFRYKVLWILMVITMYLVFLIILLVMMGLLTIIQISFLEETRNLCGRMERLASTRPRNQLLANSGNFGLLNIIKQNISHTTVSLPCGSTIIDSLNYTWNLTGPFDLKCEEEEHFSYLSNVETYEKVRILI
jgi:hypothetical protein